ncbi:MAG: hypothetical protein KatS3mg115_1825 [Candidatus Poribacteria bacterium]|nr:MAG: hypothetical protein KatS3mg115_1825 [Candidatus Poribacteria bacterium]
MKKVAIEVGHQNESFYEVLSGIEPGTKVLIRPPQLVSQNPFGR